MIQSSIETASDLFGAVNVLIAMIQCGFKTRNSITST